MRCPSFYLRASLEVHSDALDRDAGGVRTLCVQKNFCVRGSYYITGDEWGMKKRPKYEWSAGKQI